VKGLIHIYKYEGIFIWIVSAKKVTFPAYLLIYSKFDYNYFHNYQNLHHGFFPLSSLFSFPSTAPSRPGSLRPDASVLPPPSGAVPHPFATCRQSALMVKGLSLTTLPQWGQGISLPRVETGISDQVYGKNPFSFRMQTSYGGIFSIFLISGDNKVPFVGRCEGILPRAALRPVLRPRRCQGRVTSSTLIFGFCRELQPVDADVATKDYL